MEDAGFLKYVDIPFAFSITTYVLFPYLEENPISTITYITFIAGILASVLELVDPVARLLRRYTLNQFKGRKIITNPKGEKKELELNPFLIASLTSKAISKPQNRITGMFYLLFVILFSIYRVYVNRIFNVFIYDYSLIILLSISFILIVILTYKEIFRFPRKVDTLNVYYMKIRKLIAEGPSLGNMRAAIEQGDWVTARVWFARSIDDKDFVAIPEIFPSKSKTEYE
jgi:hypothetical protein